ncbi:uncharacterized protein KY384_007611 [Bacidia gigantensis]|uniref:uncharacterized protein n=1 Tax=Bacidia gigantensis TaxID=2732470 RepID=UPI001D058383|nr:uncharacterized protein KY384_007611 [Bacidia gigantensis]KAG8527459.1 hypothetical protein KY384_007611 [Bacidia gigantensis]
MRLKARQKPANISSDDFLRRSFHAAVVTKTHLYIDGGHFGYLENGISKSIEKPPGAPTYLGGALSYYAPGDVIYSGIGGRSDDFDNSYRPQNPTPPALWSLKPDDDGGGTWSRVLDSSSPALKSLSRPVDAAVAAGPKQAWFLGGVGLDTHTLGGMLQFDMDTRQFSNITKSPFDDIWRGKLEYISVYGTEGILVAFSGAKPSGLIDFISVEVFDITTQEWYNQTTTGNPPLPRKDHCVAGIASSEQTYEIFVYGGYGGKQGSGQTAYDTISILTLPAFQWISVPYVAQSPRFGHSCHHVGGSQILVVGGGDPSIEVSSDQSSDMYQGDIRSEDPNRQGLGVFEMSSLMWNDHYDASTPAYTQAVSVKNYYDGAGDSYKAGLSLSVSSLMQDAHFSPSTTTSIPITPTGATQPPKPNNQSRKKGAVASAAIGGIVALLLILGLSIFLSRLRRRKRTSQVQKLLTSEMENVQKQASGSYELHNQHLPNETDGNAIHEAASVHRPTLVEIG